MLTKSHIFVLKTYNPINGRLQYQILLVNALEYYQYQWKPGCMEML